MTSSAELAIDARHVDKSMDACMTGKECMAIFAQPIAVPTGKSKDAMTAAQFEVRNDNKLQWKCMLGKTSGMTWYEKEVCKKWDECLIASGLEDHLRAFIGAGMAPGRPRP